MPPLLSPRTPYRTKQDQAASSPCYFGLAADPSSSPFNSSAGRHAKQNHSPSSSVRSAAASSPQPVPVGHDVNLEAFRKQSDTASFTLNHTALRTPPLNRPSAKSSPSRTSSKQDRYPSSPRPVPISLPKADTVHAGELTFDDSERSRSPKRLLSSDAGILDRTRTVSPESFLESPSSKSGSLATKIQDKHPRLSLSHAPAVASSLRHQRADTLPATLEHDGPTFVPPQHIINILDSADEEALLLDLRVSTQYAKSRIRGALNLCIPTTLLKRPSYNVKRLAETFKIDSHKKRFERWREYDYIVVYDSNSSQAKDALNCLNILKKFEMEGCEGRLLIVRGGFVDFARTFSSFIDEKPTGISSSGTSTLSLDSRSDLPPVIGGCPIPPTKSAANPFFGNIRQNMDLIGGVGQIPIKIPASLSKQAMFDLPSWLSSAVNERDQGKMVSDRFLNIEKREQARMQEALSDSVAFGTPSTRGSLKPTQVAGIEKGAKNRYNNIWPFEHSRVRLQGVPAGDCDYINASHIKTSFSNKRYIATQGPIPHTFPDFWNMVWQNNVRVIVMLTAETEGGQLKAHNYWSEKSYGPIKMNFLSEHRASLELAKIQRHRTKPSADRRRSSAGGSSSGSSSTIQDKQANSLDPQPYVIVRKFALNHEQHPFERMREVTQLQYSSWPDFGAPAHPAHVLGLIEQCDTVVRYAHNASMSGSLDLPHERPVIVHCSAGCGRTGTFCTVDSVVDMLKRQRSTRQKRQGSPMDIERPVSAAGAEKEWLQRDDLDLIERTVEEFRKQRISMVQSLRQYVLCYETVLEWIAAQDAPKTA